MAKRYLVDLNMNSDLNEVIRKCNYNFRLISANQSRQTFTTIDNLPLGTTDYNELINKPQIEGVTLESDKNYEQLNLYRLTNAQIEEITTM